MTKITKWFENHLLCRIAEGRSGCPLPEDAIVEPGAIMAIELDLDGVCAAEGERHWSWQGTVEFREHGYIRMIGIRSALDTEGVVQQTYPYSREHWVA